MKTVLEYIDDNKRLLARHPMLVRLRRGTIETAQRQAALVAMAAMLARLVPVVECGSCESAVTWRPLSHRLVHLVWLANDAVRPAVLRAMEQSCEMLCAYLSKLCECEPTDPRPAQPVLAQWELFRERPRPGGSAEALATVVLDESLRQQALNLIDAVFELVEGGFDDMLFSCEPFDEAVWAGLRACRGPTSHFIDLPS